MNRSLLTAFILSGLAVLTFQTQGAVTLVREGSPAAAIALGDSIRPADLAVTVLVSNLQQMSGTTLPVVAQKDVAGDKPDDSRALILLGEGALTRKLGLSVEALGPGGILVKTGGQTVALLAKDDGSSSRTPANARPVFRLLEKLGCRYLWPGEMGKVVPRARTITVPELDVRFTPSIGQRNIRIAPPDARGAEKGLAFLGLSVAEYRAALESASRTEAEGSWAAWNGQGGNLGIVGGAAGCGLRGGWAEHGAKHPEWFALQPDGTRDQSQAKERWRLCVSNPELIEHVANDIIARTGGKAQGAISLCPNDGGFSSFCMCEKCKALDAPNAPKVRMLLFKHVGGSEREEVEYPALTDRFVHYWNAVAERVAKAVPDQLLLVEAYSYYSDPPVREKLHPNLVVRYVPSTPEGWQGWHDAGAKRLYWRPNNLHSGHRDGVLSPKARATTEALNYLSKNGVLATDMDSLYHHWATHGLHYYAAARLSWDPAQSFEALLDDYCNSGFGTGADQVKKYWLLVEKGVVPRIEGNRGLFPQITPQTIAELRALLVAAARATEKDAASHQRVAFLRAGLEFTALSAEAHALAESPTPPDPKAVEAVMQRRWQLMRALFQQQPLAVNVGVVAANDEPLLRALKWNGPSEAAKGAKFLLPTGERWLDEDQSATRK